MKGDEAGSSGGALAGPAGNAQIPLSANVPKRDKLGDNNEFAAIGGERHAAYTLRSGRQYGRSINQACVVLHYAP